MDDVLQRALMLDDSETTRHDNQPSFYNSPRTEYRRENQLPTGEVAKPGLRRTPGMRVDSEGARRFKSASLHQAGRDLRAPLENPAKFARVRGFPQS
jgi:hypothetical protein